MHADWVHATRWLCPNHLFRPFRRQAALDHGASSVSAGPDGALDATEGRGSDLVIEATNSPAGFKDAVLAARTGGRLVLVGIPDGNTYAVCNFDIISGPFLTHFSRMSRDLCRPACAAWHDPLGARAYRMLIGACNPNGMPDSW